MKSCTPEFFERLVVELLVAMGYGGSIQDAGKAIGRSGDGGIDGIIKEDILGLDMLYVQAKRWEGNVGRPEIQKFAGSLEGHRAKKGVFITTSEYTISAKEYINQIEKKIILINGKELAEYMLKYGIGVSEVTTYTIKKIDLDYFDE
ncbi:restriction endonuclease [Bacillus haynesii]|uniref:restriction endonuclease n=1 Tax=Bacillus haynesii TaxID=1925021 RepID=UPI002DF731A2